MMSSPSYKSRSHPQFSSPSLYWSSSNLPQLSATSTAPLKSQLPTLLIKTFKCRVIDTNEFPPIIDVGHIRRFITCYKIHVESCIAVMSKVSYYCKLFISSLTLVVILRSNPVVVTALDKNAINMAFLNHCGREIDEYRFCYLCFNILKQKKVPKFFSVNKVNIVICQDYPPALEALILVEKMLIARCHPVISILKLWINGALSSVTD